jgi:hypothetical protein
MVCDSENEGVLWLIGSCAALANPLTHPRLKAQGKEPP